MGMDNTIERLASGKERAALRRSQGLPSNPRSLLGGKQRQSRRTIISDDEIIYNNIHRYAEDIIYSDDYTNASYQLTRFVRGSGEVIEELGIPPIIVAVDSDEYASTRTECPF